MVFSTNLTFGVEFEFALARLDPVEGYPGGDSRLEDWWNSPVELRTHDNHPEDSRPVEFLHTLQKTVAEDPDIHGDYDLAQLDSEEIVKVNIANKLREAGLRARPMAPVQMKDGVDISYDKHSEGYDKWNVTSDRTIQPPDELYVYEKIEIISPAMWFCPDAIMQVKVMIDTITANFRVVTNASTGFHIHVGNGQETFDFPTIQKLLAFLWIFEPAITTLHPPSRILESGYSIPLRINTRLSSYGRSVDIQDPTDTVELKALDALLAIFSSTHKTVDWFMRFDPTNLFWLAAPLVSRASVRFQDVAAVEQLTVEFRHHEGTLDKTAVLHWIVTVIWMVSFVINAPTAILFEFLIEHASREDNGLTSLSASELLSELRLDEQAVYYTMKSRAEPPQFGQERLDAWNKAVGQSYRV